MLGLNSAEKIVQNNNIIPFYVFDENCQNMVLPLSNSVNNDFCVVMKGFIYKYTFPDGKVYIGQTRRPLEVRHEEHLNPKTGPLNPKFWEAFKKYGEPKREILETIEKEDGLSLAKALNERETYYINEYKSTDSSYGYNIKSKGITYSSDQLILDAEFERIWKIVAEKAYPSFCHIYDKISTGRSHTLSEEEKSFIQSSLLSNNLFSAPLKEVMDSSTFAVDNEKGLFWLSEALDYAKSVFCDESWENIRQYINEHSRSILQKSKEADIILQIDKEGNVVKEFLDADEIRQTFNITRIDNITNVLKGRQKTAYGYFWKYKTRKESEQ